MSCEICGRGSCTRSFHSLAAQEAFDNGETEEESRIADLERRLREAEQRQRGYEQEADRLTSRALAAERARDEAGRDAARYRWLRNGCNEKQSEASRIANNLYGMEWDAAIDAALAAQGRT